MTEGSSTYDVRRAQRILATFAGELDPNLFDGAREEAARALIAEILALNGKTGISVGGNKDAIVLRIADARAIAVMIRGGAIVFGSPHTSRVVGEVELIFDPVEGKLLGPPYEVTDPATGERLVRYRDALVTVVEQAATFLREH